MTKKKPANELLKVGRKPKIDDDFSNAVVSKLRTAFLNNATQLQACSEAGISRQTLITFLNKHPEFLDTIEMWKNDTNYKAKCNIREGILKKDKELSKWQLTQTDPDYSNKVKQEVTNTTPQIVVATQTDADYLKKIADVKINKDVL
jgi:hypothetical protein